MTATIDADAPVPSARVGESRDRADHVEHLDVLIIGAGLSGIGAAHYLQKPADVDEIEAGFRKPDETPEEREVPIAVPSLARVEWEHIDRVLSDCGGNVSQAARLLGVHRRSLQRKLQKRPVAR